LEKGTATSTANGIIREVQFVGLKRIFCETLQGHISSRVGDALNQRTVERDVRALANLGWFDFVSAEVVPITDSLAGHELSDLRLVFKLEERPYLGKIIFHGSELLSRERILQLLAERKIRLKLSAPVDRVELWRASRCIKGELQALGHPQANVHLVLEDVPTATVRARFAIEDGPQVLVTQVTFSGNQAVPQRLLQHQMRQVAPKAHFAHLRHKNIYTEERLQQDLERITEYYRNHGHAAARIGAPVVEMDYVVEQHLLLFRHQHLSPQLHISVPVSEGIFYQLGAVEVHDDLSTARRSEGADALVANSGLKPGVSYSHQKIMSLRDELSLLPLSSARADSLP
jgi:outer membrane protein assembly factor BamA